jgi:Calcineurin-like phosphoesterase
MNIAVFGDLHGHILLALQLCVRWQQQTGQQLDLILQVGDLGVFPDRTRLDRATRRHGERNPAVLSFLNFFTAKHPAVTTLLEELSCPLLFVRGNHEDHSWLDAREHQFPDPCFPVDAYLRLWCLKTGAPYTFQRGEEAITILGIGRIGRPASSEKTKPHYIQPYVYDFLSSPPLFTQVHPAA